MNQREFDEIAGRRLNRVRDVLMTKSKQYAPDINKLQNFINGAKLTGKTPAQVCCGYMLKHIVSIMDLAERGMPHKDMQGVEDVIDEKFTDCIAYLLLLEAILKDDANGSD